jgi:hypothetical protein
MQYEIRWGGVWEDVLVTTTGKVTVEQLDAWVQEVLADPRFRPNLRVIVDHRLAEWDHLTVGELRRRIDILVRDADRIGHQRGAWVVGRPVDFGIGRMLQAFAEGRWRVEWRICSDLDAARAWLQHAD